MIMKTSFLNYYKLVLDKVSFDPSLLAKEYRKAIRALPAGEAKDLDRWLQHRGLAAKLNPIVDHLPMASPPEEQFGPRYRRRAGRAVGNAVS